MAIIEKISYAEACEFLLPRHYSGRKPVITKAFGWFFDNKLKAVCTFGKPASPSLCRGIMNNEYSANVYELNRLCRVDNLDKQLSEFVAGCLKQVSNNNWIIVSYADTAMNHAGYIYQACNFMYTGATKARTDKYTQGNKHSRHYNNLEQNGLRKVRSAKHRYIYFATGNKKLKKEWNKKLAYTKQNYPKTPNQNYDLGNYLQPTILQNDRII
jgi:hypothetical protein